MLYSPGPNVPGVRLFCGMLVVALESTGFDTLLSVGGIAELSLV